MDAVRGRGIYYIGVTRDPFFRFYGGEGFKHHHSWQEMFVLSVSTSSGARRLETWILDDARIGLDQRNCMNRARGGGGVPRNADPELPYFLYVVYGDL